MIKNIKVEKKELKEILQYVCVVSVRFSDEGTFHMLPLISVEESSVDLLLTDEKIRETVKIAAKVVIKVFRFGFEFVIPGEVSQIKEDGTILNILFSDVTCVRNYRQFIRYNVDLKGNLFLKATRESIKVSIKDISLGGASFQTDWGDYKPMDEVDLGIIFDSGNQLTLPARIVREQTDGGAFTGMEFLRMEGEILIAFQEELRAIERNHLFPMIKARKYLKITQMYPKKVAIYSTSSDVTYYLIGLILLLGLDDYTVYNDFRSFKGGVMKTSPDVILVEVKKMDDDVLCVLKFSKERLSKVPISLILPYNFDEKFPRYREDIGELYCMNKPISLMDLETCLKDLGV